MVRDLDSTNGTRVNGQRVRTTRIYPGSELAIGKHKFRLDYVPRGRTSDAEVAELHEDIMKMTLLERAGLTKEGKPAKKEPAKSAKERAKEAEEDEAFKLLKTASRGTAEPEKPEEAQKEEVAEEGTADLETLLADRPESALSEDDVLKIVEEGAGGDRQEEEEKKK
jgi:hypothetical protein